MIDVGGICSSGQKNNTLELLVDKIEPLFLGKQIGNGNIKDAKSALRKLTLGSDEIPDETLRRVLALCGLRKLVPNADISIVLQPRKKGGIGRSFSTEELYSITVGRGGVGKGEFIPVWDTTLAKLTYEQIKSRVQK